MHSTLYDADHEASGDSYVVNEAKTFIANGITADLVVTVVETDPGQQHTLEHVTSRTAFGKPTGSFQNTRARLAEIATEVDVARSYVDDCIRALDAGELTAVDAAKAKWWCTELQGRAPDTCLQLFGGYGYLTGYPIALAWADARVTRSYGGTTEIMEEVVGRDLRL